MSLVIKTFKQSLESTVVIGQATTNPESKYTGASAKDFPHQSFEPAEFLPLREARLWFSVQKLNSTDVVLKLGKAEYSVIPLKKNSS